MPWIKPEWVEQVLLDNTISPELKRAAFHATMKDPFSRHNVSSLSGGDVYTINLTVQIVLSKEEAQQFYKEEVDALGS